MSAFSCPKCQNPDTAVYDSRARILKSGVRRRRRCSACQERFTTLEMTEIQLRQMVAESLASLLGQATERIAQQIIQDAKDDALS